MTFFKLNIIAGVTEWKRHGSTSLPADWFGCCTHELLTALSTAAGGNRLSIFDSFFFFFSWRCPSFWKASESSEQKGCLWSNGAYCPSGCRKRCRLWERIFQVTHSLWARVWERVERAGEGGRPWIRLQRENIHNSINGSYHTVLFQIESLECICVYFVAIYDVWFISWVYKKPCARATM